MSKKAELEAELAGALKREKTLEAKLEHAEAKIIELELGVQANARRRPIAFTDACRLLVETLDEELGRCAADAARHWSLVTLRKELNRL